MECALVEYTVLFLNRFSEKSHVSHVSLLLLEATSTFYP